MNISILVLLYDCRLEESKTLTSLLDFDDFNKLSLHIINNGPVEVPIDLVSGYDNVIVSQDNLSNRSLSKIYNDFYASNNSDYYIIFDQDTNVTDSYKDFLSSLNSGILNADLFLPIITCNNKIYYPMTNGKVISQRNSLVKNVRSIASGLVVSKNACLAIEKKYSNLFDVRFYFYGVDSSFFYRVNSLGLSCKVAGELKHSLSRLESIDSMSSFRIKERSFDFGLTTRHYCNADRLFKFVYFIFTNPLNIGKYKYLSFKYVLSALVSGKHYRDT